MGIMFCQSSCAITPMIKKTFPILWLLVVYAGTAISIGRDPRPVESVARVVFEARHVVTHLVSFAFLIWLVGRAIRPPAEHGFTRNVAILIGLGLVIGLGQETLQALLRHELYALDSAWDVCVDTGGAALGWWIYHRRARIEGFAYNSGRGLPT